MVVDKLNREEELVLLGARQVLSDDQLERIANLMRDPKLSWDEVAMRAEWYRVSALLYSNIQSLPQATNIPESIMDQFKTISFQNMAKNLYLRSELEKVLDIFNRQGISVILLKGSALLDCVYESPSLRPMSDADLLVREEHSEIAQNLILELGYQEVGTMEDRQRTRQVHRHLPSLFDETRASVFEVHTHIVSKDSPLHFDISAFWDRATPSERFCGRANIPSPQDLLAHIAIHFFLDRRFRSYAGLSQICDMAELLKRYCPDINFDQFADEILKYELRGPLYSGLSLAQKLFDAPLPEDFLARIRPEGISDEKLRLLLRRRVLDTKHVVASSLVNPEVDYTFKSLATSMAGRLFPSIGYMTDHYAKTVESGGLGRSYARRLVEITSALKEYVCNPRELWEQVMVDKWIHSMQSNSNPSER